ncbi:hypothetical protein ABE137_11830 [Brevibacillus laterosporus]|uniref:hypothetical protein n=1 Tax=Brevibacillus laterosporus TaxID=1465 RepID=UPI003D244194
MNQLANALISMEKGLVRSFNNPHKLSENLKVVEDAENFLSATGELPFIRHAIRERIMRNFLETRPSEKVIHVWFKENVNNLMGEKYQIVKRKNNPKHIPDFWLLKASEYVPVEIKLHSFNKQNLKQLLRYMYFYKCKEGIAVGSELNCDLPSNVTFIKYRL